MTDTNPRPLLAKAREAADSYLTRKVRDGSMTPAAAKGLATDGFNVTTRILSGLREEGLSEQCIVDAFQARLDRARAANDERSTVAAEYALAIWDGMLADLAAYLRATG